VALSKKNKKQLFVSISVMVLALITLVAGVVAWFSTRNEANVENVTLRVERKALELVRKPELIEFPCATKLLDMDATIFNERSIVVKEYEIAGVGQLHTTVDCSKSDGMIGYVWKGENDNYYEEIIDRLKELKGTENLNDKIKNFDDLYTAIAQLNDCRAGETNDAGNTVVTVVYWVEYDEIENVLNTDGYTSLDYNAFLTFVA